MNPQVASQAFNVSSAVFGALLGFLLAGLLWLWQQSRTKGERVKNVATVLLAELWSLDWTLRQIRDDERASLSYGVLPMHLFLESHRVALDFPPKTIQWLMLFRGLCQDLDYLRERTRDDHLRAQQEAKDDEHSVDRVGKAIERFQELEGRRNHMVRAKASFALSMVPDLKNALEATGGVFGDPGHVQRTDGFTLPKIPASPFGHGA